MDIDKIRTNQLTEDEKMEIIADYLENGGGGDTLKLKIYPNFVDRPITLFDYYQEAISTPNEQLNGNGGKLMECYFEDATATDEAGNEVTASDIMEALEAGKNVQIVYMEHLGDIAIEDGDTYTFTPNFGDGRYDQLQQTTVYAAGESPYKLWDLSSMGLRSCWANTSAGFLFYPCGLAIQEGVDSIMGSFAVEQYPSEEDDAPTT